MMEELSTVLMCVGFCGVVLLAWQECKWKVMDMLVRWKVAATLWRASPDVYVVDSAQTWENIFPRLFREAVQHGAVGLDCEWVQVKGLRRPVALLQVATLSGLCVLIRLCHLKRVSLPGLKEFLNDESILKAGVGTIEDSDYLHRDYHFQIGGCVDLRHLVLRKNEIHGGCGGSHNLGLGALAKAYLNRSLDKDWRVRTSDWEADSLTKRQIKYAADDALVGMQLLLFLVGEIWGKMEQPPFSLGPLLLPTSWSFWIAKAIHRICHGYVNKKFTTKTQEAVVNTSTVLRAKAVHRRQREDFQVTTRKGPLYYNCQLLAPDNQPLCTLDPKKAQWYVDKGLGHFISEEPLIVRLNFEPTGRPQAEQEDGEFYLQERLNVCVVCGQRDSYIRKSVVPHEYRKHFPALLKHHQNHDVLLLCFPCHRRSNILDAQLRVQLGKEFQAPVANEPEAKGIIDNSRKSVRNAARALLRHHASLPEARALEYQHTLQQFFESENFTEKQLEQAANMEVKVYKNNCQDHGQVVVEAYKKNGLSKLEQRWRQYFLDTMSPRFLPDCWSVTHNTFKMKLKMARLPLDHEDRLVYKMALVGTEGNIDIPYKSREAESQSSVDCIYPVTERGNKILLIPKEPILL